MTAGSYPDRELDALERAILTNSSLPRSDDDRLDLRDWDTEPSASSDGEQRPIDRIAVRKSGGFVYIPLDNWLGLLRSEQAILIKDKRVTFLSGDVVVPVREALLWIQQQR